MKAKNKKVFLIVISAVLILFFFFRYVSELGSWKGTSFESYLDRAYIGGSFAITSLPAGAQDFRYQCYNYGLAAYSYAGFTLSGSDYDDFVGYIAGLREPSAEDKEKFVGKKVSQTMDYHDEYGAYVGFPQRKCTYVIDDELSEYTILYYDSYHGAGMQVNAIVSKPETGRFVVIYGGSN